MKVDVLVAEIGSTTTLVNAFNIYDTIEYLGSGVANTTVDTDVREGLQEAIKCLENTLNVEGLTYNEMFASSSAAGGLKVTVSGLVYEMTVRAAKEAALNAGANIHLVTAGILDEDDLERIVSIKPNMILVAGGTDYGEKKVAIENIKKVEQLQLNIPIIYAGNIENHYGIDKYFKHSSQKNYLKVVENVYPRVDFLNILPLRQAIHETFEEHIIHANGMKHVKEMVNQSIMPTPGSVMESTMIISETLGNVMTIDVGGATTDIHSIATPSEEFKKYSEGYAKEKRTVEGDLGVFVNFKKVLEALDKTQLKARLNINDKELNKLINNYTYMPKTPLERKLVYELTKVCVHKALDRHVGDLMKVYTSNGQKFIPEGKDLTQIQTIILTGGPLIHLENTEVIVEEYLENNPQKLLPKNKVDILKDHDYIMSSIGVLSLKHKEESIQLLKQSFRIHR